MYVIINIHIRNDRRIIGISGYCLLSYLLSSFVIFIPFFSQDACPVTLHANDIFCPTSSVIKISSATTKGNKSKNYQKNTAEYRFVYCFASAIHSFFRFLRIVFLYECLSRMSVGTDVKLKIRTQNKLSRFKGHPQATIPRNFAHPDPSSPRSPPAPSISQ